MGVFGYFQKNKIKIMLKASSLPQLLPKSDDGNIKASIIYHSRAKGEFR